ncbi:MAG: hypothetical protein L0229_24735 [Blastocatellia bacterium]|nr:hypothetical protein [Blastocatellia bacterium]
MNELANLESDPSLLLRRIASRPALFQAWRKVRANRGAAGVDAVSIRLFERDLEPNLAELARILVNRSYEPLPARPVTVIKPNGKQRELAIPTVRDRVAQRAVLDQVEPVFEPFMLDCSFAFRPGRSVEMAVQRLVVARAQGRLWTVYADIEDFFPSINHRLLMEDLSAGLGDRDILRLIAQWLDAGALDGSQPSPAWIARWRSSLAGANLAVRDAVNDLLDELLSSRLGMGGPMSESFAGDDFDESDFEDTEETRGGAKKSTWGGAAARRLIQDGMLLALARRGALKGLLTAKVLGIGGAALALALAGPPIIRKLRSTASTPTGALQGAPLSPLLSNIYLHPFDVAMTEQGYSLTRYADDFRIVCRTEAEARRALASIDRALGERRLRLHKEKTRVVPPGEEFDFLGYHFSADGRVIAPPGVHEVVARRVVEFADRYARKASAQTRVLASKTQKKARGTLDRIKERLKNK